MKHTPRQTEVTSEPHFRPGLEVGFIGSLEMSGVGVGISLGTGREVQAPAEKSLTCLGQDPPTPTSGQKCGHCGPGRRQGQVLSRATFTESLALKPPRCEGQSTVLPREGGLLPGSCSSSFMFSPWD